MARRNKKFTSYYSDEGPMTSSDEEYVPRKCCICGNSSDSDWRDDACEDCKRSKPKISRNNYSHDLLHEAIDNHNCTKIRQLLKVGAKPCTTPKSTNCFILARSLYFILKKFLEIEPSGVNCQDSKGLTMLMLSENVRTLRLLCKYKPDVNLLNDDGNNVLFHLLKTRRLVKPWELEQFVNLGLDVNLVDSNGETALRFSIKEGVNADTIVALIQAGAKVVPPPDNERIIFTQTIQNDHLCFSDKVDFLETLIKHEIDVIAKDSEGYNVMYYLIKAHFMQLLATKEDSDIKCISKFEDILSMLLQKNCELQGLDISIQIRTGLNPLIYPHLSFEQNLDVFGTLVHYGACFEFLEELLYSQLYTWTMSSVDLMTPLTACLSRLCIHDVRKLENILELSEYFISLGVDVTHRSLNRNFRFDVSEGSTDMHGTDLMEELIYPDALFFVAQMRTTEVCWIKLVRDGIQQLEDFLRLLLRFWPHPPLFTILIRVGQDWDQRVTSDMTLLMKLLIKIGGALPLGSRHYKAIKNLLQKAAESNVEWQEMLESFLKLEGGIPSLRSLSRAAFRATVKKTCATGLDFSEFRVLCQRKMVPLPSNIVDFLDFRA